MSKAKRPWMKWYPADWRSDPGLRMCSFAARGLWADLLALMHEAEPYGCLLVNGKPPSPAQLAAMLGGTARQIETLLGELEASGVFSRDDEGIIYSRRMIRDHAASLEGKTWVEKRWANREPIGDPNRGATPDPITQKPEARSQKQDNQVLASQAPPDTTAKRGSRLPDDWEPTAGDVAFAEQEGWAPDDWGREAAKFRDHWHAKPGAQGRKLDWSATWRNWLRNGARAGPGKRPAEPTTAELLARF